MRHALARRRQLAERRRSFRNIARRASTLEQLEERRVLAAPIAITDSIYAQWNTITTSTEYVAQVLADQPVSYWRLNDATGSTSAIDQTGGNTGTVSGSLLQEQQGPLMYAVDNKAYDFTQSASNNKIDIPYSATLNPAGSFTIELWTRVEGGSSHRSPFTSRQDTGGNTRGYILYVTPSNTWEFWTGQGVGAWGVTAGSPIVANKWTHVVASFAAVGAPDANGAYSGTTSLYIDGKLAGQSTTQKYKPTTANPERIGAGASEGTGSFFFDGKIDEVAFYNKALTSAQVSSHYLSSLLINDTDVDPTDVLSVTAVNGTALSGGTVTVTTAKGALATVKSDGTYVYNPNGAFNSITTGLTQTDSFTYTVSDGATTATTTVNVSINVPLAAANDSYTATEGLTSASPNYESLILADTPLAFWPLDVTSGTSVPNLIVPGTNTGTISGGVTLNQAASPANKNATALGFNGSTGKIDVPYNAALNPASYTVELWAMVEGGAGSFRSPITSRETANGLTGYILYASDTNVWQFWTGQGNGGWSIVGSTPVVLNKWTHVVATFNANSGPDGNGSYTGTQSIYINGTLAATKANALYKPNATTPLRIGAGGTEGGGQYWFNGKVDEVSVYGGALSAAQIQQHYTAGLTSSLLGNDGLDSVETTTIAQVQGVPLTGASITATTALGAAITVYPNGTFSYNPSGVAAIEALRPGATITDSFTYSLVDSSGLTSLSPGTVSITVTGTNDAVVANDDAVVARANVVTSVVARNFLDFQTTTTAGAAFAAAYPFTGATAVTSTSGGVARIASGESELQWTGTAPAGDVYTISVDIGAETANFGSYNVGIRIGNAIILYHPGYTPIPGAININGSGNMNMGWVPPANVANNFNITVNRVTGVFTVVVTNTVNPAQTYTYSFTNLAAASGAIFLRRSGPNNGSAIFDNFHVGTPKLTANDTDPDTGTTNAAVPATITSAQGATVVVNADGTFTYDPRSVAALQALPHGAYATDSFTYTGTDNDGSTDPATVTVTVVGTNAPIVAVNDAYTANEDALLTVPAGAANLLLANDTDVDTGDTKTITTYTATSARGATVVVNADGSFTYNPTSAAALQALNAGETVVDTFTYTIRDFLGTTATGTASVTVTGVNDAIIVANETANTNEDATITGGTRFFEPFNTNLAATSDPAVFQAAYPNLTYNDTLAGSTGTVAVSGGVLQLIGPNNSGSNQFVKGPAVASDLTVAVDLGRTGNAGNAGSFNLGVTIGQFRVVFHVGYQSGSLMGALRIEGGSGNILNNSNVGWVPAFNTMHHLTVHVTAAGVFTVELVDGNNPNNIYRVSAAASTVVGNANYYSGGAIGFIRSGGTAEIASYDNFTAAWGTLVDNDRDPDAGSLLRVSGVGGTASLTGTSALGATVTLTPEGTYTYNPSTSATLQALPVGASTIDTFTYTVTNGRGDSTQGTVSINVTGVNDAPIAVNDTYTVNEDTLLTIPAAALNSLFSNDINVDTSDPLSVIGYDTTSPLLAAVTVNANGSFTYDPRVSATLQGLPAGMTKVDTFRYTITDTAGATSMATVSITVTGVDDPLTVTNDTSSTGENTAIAVGSVYNQPFDAPAANTAAFVAAYPTLQYSENVAGGGASVVNGVLHLTGPNNSGSTLLVLAPGTAGDTTISVDLSGAGSPGSFNIGVAVGQNRIVFHPGFAAGGAFRIEGPGIGTLGNQNMGWVPGLWTSGNNLLHHLTIHVSSSGVFDIKLVDGANPNNFYSATFTNPGSVGGAISLVRAGAATSDALFDNLRISKTVLDNDRDIDYNTSLAVSQLNGSATLSGLSAKGATVVIQPDGRYTYDPNTSAILQTLAIGQSTTDTFTYTASNGAGGTTTATVTITVTGGNDAPFAVSDSYSTTEDSLLTIPAAASNSLLSNDYDLDVGDTLAVSAFQAVSTLGATVTVGADGALTYDPRNSVALQALAVNASVVDTFTYTIQDVHGATATATVSVTVGGLNDTAQFTYVIAATQIGYESTPLALNPLASISDADGNETFTYSIAWGDGTPLSTGGATVTSTGATQPTLADIVSSHTYADNGTYTGSLTVTDSQGQEIVTPFTIRILNLAPTAILEDGPTAGVPGLPLWFNFGATDPSPVDTAAGFTYVVNWGDGTPTQLISDPAELQHTFATTGNFTVTVRARDKDNHLSPVLATVVPITAAAVIDGTLYVGGTGQSDKIIVQSFTSIRMNVKILTVPVGASRVIVFGNDGNDTISVVTSGIPVSLYGGAGDDYLSGGLLDDVLDGGIGSDKIFGYAGKDIILGGPDNDSIYGGADDDYLSGNELINPTVPTNLTPWLYVSPGYLLDYGDSGADYINGEAGSDQIFGGNGPDNLIGGLGNDYLRGGAGADKLDGSEDEDFLFGEADGDLLYGRDGDDVLVGGSGSDTLFGGSGSDLLLAGDLATVVANENASLQALWLLWNATPTTLAASALLTHAVDDLASDTIYGDTNADWYLLFRTEKDKVATISELKLPNMFLYK